jgi:hypothetical protein
VHVGAALCAVSHVALHAPQLAAVFVGVSQPLVSGAAASQFAKPVSHPVYWHVVPVHEAPWLCFVSHAAPQALQSVVVVVFVSQPLVSGAVVLQSA